MKKNLRAVIALTTLCISSAIGATADDPVKPGSGVPEAPPLTLRPVTARLFIVTGGGANIVFFVGGDAVLVVDSGNTPDLGRQAVELIRTVTDKPLKDLVLTHYHSDHVGGAESFPSSTTVIAQARILGPLSSLKETTVTYLEGLIRDARSQVGRLEAGKDPRAAEVRKELDRRIVQRDDWRRRNTVTPGLLIETSRTIPLGDDRVELLYWGPGHTNGDLMVLFPSEKAVDVGDLFFLNAWVPRLDADAGASVDNWLEIYEKLEELDVRTVIAGHGDPMSKEAFLELARRKTGFLRELKAEVRKLVDQGVPLAEIKRRVKLPAYEDMELYGVLLPYNIDGAYREVLSQRDASR